MEMNVLLGGCRVDRLQHVTIIEIRDRMAATETIMGEIEAKRLKWYSYVRRMP